MFPLSPFSIRSYLAFISLRCILFFWNSANSFLHNEYVVINSGSSVKRSQSYLRFTSSSFSFCLLCAVISFEYFMFKTFMRDFMFSHHLTLSVNSVMCRVCHICHLFSNSVWKFSCWYTRVLFFHTPLPIFGRFTSLISRITAS